MLSENIPKTLKPMIFLIALQKLPTFTENCHGNQVNFHDVRKSGYICKQNSIAKGTFL